jgi:S-adenosylmethionine:tRNA ribosyltransferase-isomerase
MDHQTKTDPRQAVRRADYEFELPPELIAQEPAPRRDSARLLVLDRATRTRLHRRVTDLPEFLSPGDLLIVNDTKVIPARLKATTQQGGSVELLFVRPLGKEATGELWLCLGRPARRLRSEGLLTLTGGADAEVQQGLGDGRYAVLVRTASVLEYLSRHGEVPLPPYIRRPQGPRPADRERYQTIFARSPGAVAAPTAGLHFTPELVARLRERGVEMASLTLHVGPGTFQPIRSEDIRAHRMEPEWCSIPERTAALIRAAKARARRVVAVGTTCTRALESSACEGEAIISAGEQWADLFIYPGYQFRVIDGLFTNFHLPGSTLVALVAAFAGREWLLDSYREAIARGYRFYSYGDAMLIL